jgi:putative transposase
MSETYERLAHSSWDCKYHVVFVPKRRRKVLFGQAQRKLGEVFHALARQKECQIIAFRPAVTFRSVVTLPSLVIST